MERKVIVSIVLGLLVVISAVQALQLTELKAKVSDASFSTVKSSTQAVPVASSGGSSGGGNTVAANIANLPSMVGGC